MTEDEEPTGLPVPKKPTRHKKKHKGKKKKPKPKPKVHKQEPTAEEIVEELFPEPEKELDAPVVGNAPNTTKATHNIYACLWRGENLPDYSNDAYGLNYVEYLMRGMQRHVKNGRLTILADEHYAPLIEEQPRLQDIRVERLEGHGCGGWSNVLEIFRDGLRPKCGKRHMAVGLDTLFMGDCEWLFHWDHAPVGLPLDPYRSPVPCDAVITYDYEGASFVWDAFQVAKLDDMKDYLFANKPSEMQLLRYLYAQEGWPPLEAVPEKLLSYKCHVLRGANPWEMKADIVYFHGHPKPHELPKDNRINQEWRR